MTTYSSPIGVFGEIPCQGLLRNTLSFPDGLKFNSGVYIRPTSTLMLLEKSDVIINDMALSGTSRFTRKEEFDSARAQCREVVDRLSPSIKTIHKLPEVTRINLPRDSVGAHFIGKRLVMKSATRLAPGGSVFANTAIT